MVNPQRPYILNEIANQIEKYNLNVPVRESTALMFRILSDIDSAHQFVMVELDIAREGNAVAKRFVESAAIPRTDYVDAQFLSAEESESPIVGTELLTVLCAILALDDDMESAFRLAVADGVMKKFQIGPYMKSNSFLEQMPMESIINQFSEASESLVGYVSKEEESPYGVFVNILNDLANYSESCEGDPPKVQMAYAYARRCAAAGLYIQGVLDRREYAYQEQTFRNFQQKLALENEECQSKEFQIASSDEATRFLKTYDSRLTAKIVSQMVGAVLSIVPNEEILCPKDNGMLITPDGVFAWLEEG